MPPTRVPARYRSKDDEKRRPNALFHGDNLEILLRYVEDASVDLIYLDPPFQSGRNYNLLFKREDGSRSPSQKQAFTDTWHWDTAAAAAYHEVLTTGTRAGNVLELMRRQLDTTPMLAYLSMMAIRLIELHRVLKPTGSLYLHCDPTASHYLKLVLDAIFGTENFRNEIVWLRSKNPKGSQHTLTRFSPSTDTLLFYAKSEATSPQLDRIRIPLDAARLADKYPYSDEHGPYQDGPILCSNSMGPRPNLVYEYKGFTPGPAGWRVKKELLEEIDRRGDLNWTKNGVRRKLRLEKEKGDPIGSFWGDIPPLNSQAAERIGYPTQKPMALLERILLASSNEGDTVLDPFCGCGTAVDAAQKLKRKWIGIDVAQQAIGIIEERLEKQYGEIVKASYELVREPQDLDGAKALALQDRHQFEKWAIRLVGGDSDEKAKGADHGIDGTMHFREAPGAPIRTIIISVKSGHTTVRDVRDLVGTVGREKAAIGVLIMLNNPTGPMKAEASAADSFYTTHSNQPERFAKIQILTIEEILEGEMIKAPINFRRRGPKRASPQIEIKFPTSARGS